MTEIIEECLISLEMFATSWQQVGTHLLLIIVCPHGQRLEEPFHTILLLQQDMSHRDSGYYLKYTIQVQFSPDREIEGNCNLTSCNSLDQI